MLAIQLNYGLDSIKANMPYHNVFATWLSNERNYRNKIYEITC